MIWKKEIESEVAKFANDTNLLKIAKSKADCRELQWELADLGAWATRWQMKFSIDQCKVTPLGNQNSN